MQGWCDLRKTRGQGHGAQAVLCGSDSVDSGGMKTVIRWSVDPGI